MGGLASSGHSRSLSIPKSSSPATDADGAESGEVGHTAGPATYPTVGNQVRKCCSHARNRVPGPPSVLAQEGRRSLPSVSPHPRALAPPQFRIPFFNDNLSRPLCGGSSSRTFGTFCSATRVTARIASSTSSGWLRSPKSDRSRKSSFPDVFAQLRRSSIFGPSKVGVTILTPPPHTAVALNVQKKRFAKVYTASPRTDPP